jgi:SAM-dependent methyltransferase
MIAHSITGDLQPDQRPERWDDHVLVYERVFEPFTLGFAHAAINRLELGPESRVLDVGAGCGGAALELASSGMKVTAIDASPQMIQRATDRALMSGLAINSLVMDGQALTFADACFDAALSVFGVVLFPDAVRGLQEMRRVVRPGGRLAVVTWTEPQNYELAAALRAASLEVWPDQPEGPLPAQLRYREVADFRALFSAAGLTPPRLDVVSSALKAPSARWLAERIEFAPGMAAMIGALGERRDAVLAQFVRNLEVRHGTGELSLGGVGFVGIASVPA